VTPAQRAIHIAPADAGAEQARCRLEQHTMLRAADERGEAYLPHLVRWLQRYTPDRREADEPITFS
jgi:hypothetical protein